MTKTKKEVRALQLDAPAGDAESMVIEGRAIVFEQPTVLGVVGGTEYKEVISRAALDGADLSDVPLKYNHSDGFMILGRTRSKTLELIPDEDGLRIRATLPNTTHGRDLYELIKRGDVDKMSFAFTIKAESYDRATHTRRIEKIDKLFDVSAVDYPAYEQTSLTARTLAETDAAELAAAEAEERKRARLRLLLQL